MRLLLIKQGVTEKEEKTVKSLYNAKNATIYLNTWNTFKPLNGSGWKTVGVFMEMLKYRKDINLTANGLKQI